MYDFDATQRREAGVRLLSPTREEPIPLTEINIVNLGSVPVWIEPCLLSQLEAALRQSGAKVIYWPAWDSVLLVSRDWKGIA